MEKYTKIIIISLRMERFTEIDQTLKKDGYTRRQLFDWIQRYYPHYDDHSCAWILGSLLSRGVLYNAGYDAYFKKGNSSICPIPKSSAVNDVLTSLRRLDSEAKYVCYASSDLNGLLGDESCMDLILFEVEKKHLYPLYLELKAKTKSSILLNPTSDERDRYYSEGCILLRPLPSKAPCGNGKLVLEKLCVDLLKSKDLEAAFPLLEPQTAIRKILEEYDINIKTLLSYAERRGVRNQMVNLIYSSLPNNKMKILELSSKFPKKPKEYEL